jgi:ACS family hexuronate transporter-like MFS transporter
MDSMLKNNYRWVVVVLLLFATTINYLDRQLIGLLKPILEKEFSWTETDFAKIVMAFTAAYAIGLLICGRIIDKIGSKLGYAISITIWSIAGIFHAFTRGVTGFATARLGLGLGEAGNFPAAMKTVAEWFPQKERALATGIFNAGTSFGVILSLFIVPIILQYAGWQEVFWITGSFGFIWLIFWWKFYEIPEKQKRLSKEEYKYIRQDNDNIVIDNTLAIKWSRLFKFRQTWAYITGKGLIDPIYWFFLFWLPSYFSTTFQLDLKKPSYELMIIYTATTVGSIFGGYFSSYLVRKGWETIKARKFALLIFAVLELTIILAQFAKGPWMAVGLLSIAVAAHQAWAANVFTLASDLFPSQVVSSVVGIGGMAGAIGGILFPIFIGSVLDSYKAAGNINAGYNLIFTICGCTYLIALLIIHLLTINKVKINLEEIQ